MNPQEQNKDKARFQNQSGMPAGVKKDESPKASVGTNIKPGSYDKKTKGEDSDESDDRDSSECGTNKGSCGSK